MNREKRKQHKNASKQAIQKAKAYVVVTWDGEMVPVVRFNVESCNDEKDDRHFVMQKVAEYCEKITLDFRKEVSKRIAERRNAALVEKLKAERSKELSGEPIIDVSSVREGDVRGAEIKTPGHLD